MMPASTNHSLIELRRAVAFVKEQRSTVLNANRLDHSVFDSWVGAADQELTRGSVDDHEMLSALRVIVSWTRGIEQLAGPTAVLNRACGVSDASEPSVALTPTQRRIARHLWEQNASEEEIARCLDCPPDVARRALEGDRPGSPGGR